MYNNCYWPVSQGKAKIIVSHFDWIWKKLAKLRCLKRNDYNLEIKDNVIVNFWNLSLEKSILNNPDHFQISVIVIFWVFLASQIDVQEILREPTIWPQWCQGAFSEHSRTGDSCYHHKHDRDMKYVAGVFIFLNGPREACWSCHHHLVLTVGLMTFLLELCIFISRRTLIS